jgi:hypothetical protein
MCTWIALVLVLCPLLVHGQGDQDDKAAKGRGGGGGGRGRGNGGKKPQKTVKIGGWNAPLWAVIMIPSTYLSLPACLPFRLLSSLTSRRRS